MTIRQRIALKEYLDGREGEFHHGDCIGSDAEAHDIALSLGFYMVIHPPINESKRAFRTGHILKRKSYLIRNRGIVDSTDRLLATPNEDYERLRSGTWSTIRYAKKCGKLVTIIFPDGSTETT